MSEIRDPQAMLTNIFREVGETKVALDIMSKKLDEHIEYSSSEFKSINALDNEQNRILDKHIEGVNTLKDMYLAHRIETSDQISLLKQILMNEKEASAARLLALEKPHEIVMSIAKILVWVATVGGTIVGAFKLFGGSK